MRDEDACSTGGTVTATAEDSGRKPLVALLVYIEGASYPWQISRRTQLGLYYLAQHAADAGYEVGVDCVSANDHLTRRLRRLLREHSCNLIGFYVDQDNLWDVRRLLPQLAAEDPDLRIIIGGPQPTADPGGTLDRLPEALCAAIGEGEETFVELLTLKSLSQENLATCEGIAYRSANGDLILTGLREPIVPLDRLSIPRRERFNVDSGEPPQPLMMAGRGCIGHCAFCFEGRRPAAGKRLRLHSAERCLEEFSYLTEQFPGQYICILDDTFVANPKRAQKFCRMITDRYGDSVKWFCEARVDTLVHKPDLLPMMIEAGLLRLQIGAESGSQEILDAYHKGTTIEQLWTVVEEARRHGLLSLFGNFIVGGAFETRESYQATEDLAVSLLKAAPGHAAFGSSYFTPYPGTLMAERPSDFGIRIIDQDGVTGQGDHHVVCRTEELSRLEILELGCRFDKVAGQTMRNLLGEMPRELIERHFEANHRWNLDTEWFAVLCDELPAFGYFTSVTNGSAVSFAEACKRGFEGTYPFRTFDFGPSHESRYLVRTHRGLIRELDEIDGVLTELSSGKLPHEEVLGVLQGQHPGIDPEVLSAEANRRFESLDEDFLVVWRVNVD